MLRLPSVLGLCLLVLTGTRGCASGPPMSAPQAIENRGIEAYRLNVGDKVRIVVFGEEALSGEFTLGADGRISLPLIGEIPAAGLTISRLQIEVADAYRDGYLKAPRLTAEVLVYRPFYILGEVEKPGEYPYASGLTILNAVATAGGFTYRADTRRVLVKSAEATTEAQYPLTATAHVAPGDTIRIRERFF